MGDIDGMNDEQLVAEAQAGLRGQGANVEMMRRLKACSSANCTRPTN